MTIVSDNGKVAHPPIQPLLHWVLLGFLTIDNFMCGGHYIAKLAEVEN